MPNLSASPKEMRQERAGLIKRARELTDLASKENRDLSAEEQGQWDAIFQDADKLEAAYLRAEKLEQAESGLTEPVGRRTAPAEPTTDLPTTPASKPQELRARPEYEKAFASYLSSGSVSEMLALRADSDAEGGYLVPHSTINSLIQAVDNLTVVRSLTTRIRNTGGSVGVPSLDADPADSDWTTELATGSEDSTMAFGKRELTPHPLAKRIKVSNKLLRSAVLDVESLVRDRLAYKFAVTEENAFINGSGSGQPLGLFTASANGISTGRDESTGNTTTAIAADGLINAKYKLKQQYQAAANTRWLFHRDGVKMIRKLKDGNGQYLWQPGLSRDRGDTILDVPVVQSEYVPSTFTTGLYVGLIGDLRFYWIVDALTMTMQRLVELYAETNQVGFIGRLECDGMPVLEEAFVRVKLA